MLALSQGQFCSLSHPVSVVLGGSADLNWPKGSSTPYGVTISNKSWGGGRREGCLECWCFFPNSCTQESCFTGSGECLPAVGSSEWVLCVPLEHAAIALPSKLPVSTPGVLTCTFAVLSPTPSGDSKQAAVCCGLLLADTQQLCLSRASHGKVQRCCN